MPSIDKLRHNIRHAVSLSAFSPNLIHRIRYFFLCTVTFRDHSINHHVQSNKTKSGLVILRVGWLVWYIGGFRLVPLYVQQLLLFLFCLIVYKRFVFALVHQLRFPRVHLQNLYWHL